MNHYTQLNIEGINKIDVIDTSKVDDILPGDAITGGPVIIQLKYGASFENIPLVKGTGSFVEDHQSDETGEYFLQSISLSHAGNRKEADAWLTDNQYKDFIIKITDRNQNIRIVGTLDSPVRLLSPMNNPSSGRNEYTFTFSSKSDIRAPYLQDGDSIKNSDRVFSYQFSENFG